MFYLGLHVLWNFLKINSFSNLFFKEGSLCRVIFMLFLIFISMAYNYMAWFKCSQENATKYHATESISTLFAGKN